MLTTSKTASKSSEFLNRLKIPFNEIIQVLQQFHIRNGVLILGLGDTISVGVLLQEGSKKRIQTYCGVLIRRHCSHVVSTITLNIVLHGVGVERSFFVCSPVIKFIEVRRCAKVCRSKLYYLRSLKGTAARLRECKKRNRSRTKIVYSKESTLWNIKN